MSDKLMARAYGTPIMPAGQLNEVAAAISTWHGRELPGKSRLARLAKVAEEGGECAGAGIKLEECEFGMRSDFEDRLRKAEDEVGDAIISALGAYEALGITDAYDALLRRWAVVRQRQFATKGRA